MSSQKEDFASLERYEQKGPDLPLGRLVRNEYGCLVIAKTGFRITPEMVREMSEDELVG